MKQLPIFSVIPHLKQAFEQRDEVVLEAPPGAGKTTVVPLQLLSEAWLGDQKILVLEPRRLAARAAAERMASTLSENVGETVGYRVRLDTSVGRNTRIEVITEGILSRMLQTDPSLEGVGLVIFDEFHERHLDGDLSLALALHGRELFEDLREQPLKLLIMSATLDGPRLSELLLNAPVVSSQGKSFPVECCYGQHYEYDRNSIGRVIERAVDTVIQALEEQEGSILVFLPGQGEIRRTETRLQKALIQQPSINPQNILLAPLYGDLSLEQQRRAIDPAPAGKRKVVLATAIAESSLTIDGVRVVVDTGLSRQAKYDPNSGLSRLVTRRASQASATQRKGRAGRTEPGVCYRLWSQSQHHELAQYSEPEILQADLTSLTLQLLQWGVNRPEELQWLDAPTAGAYQQSLQLLRQLGAIDRTAPECYGVTPLGEAIAQLPVHPRLAHMMVESLTLHEASASQKACDIAALLGERDFLRGEGCDLSLRLAYISGDLKAHKAVQGSIHRIRQQSQKLHKNLKRIVGDRLPNRAAGKAHIAAQDLAGVLLAFAFPDRIAQRRRHSSTHYLLANGREVSLTASDNLSHCSWLVIADAGGGQHQNSDQIYLAEALNPEYFESVLEPLITTADTVEWHDQQQKLIAERQQKIGGLTVHARPLTEVDPEQKQQALLAVVKKRGLALFHWSPEVQQWRARVELLRRVFSTAEQSWPDVSDAGLLASLDLWLSPFIEKVTQLAHFKALDLAPMLQSLLVWPQPQQLDQLAPLRLTVPSGSKISLDYSVTPPVLAVKLQEMFGCEHTPTIAQGRMKISVHLLSPARRPLQVTQDLSGFWGGSYQDVKKEMKGRYPKHPWPDDPTQALATAKTKARLQREKSQSKQ